MPYQDLSAKEAVRLCQQAEVRVLDCRDVNSYEKGHLPGAVHVNDAVVASLLKIEKKTPLLLYCYHGNSSRDLANLFSRFGFVTVYNLEGGWQGWCNIQIADETTLSPELSRWMEQYGFNPANINSRIGNGMSALMQAALLAETTIVESLIKSGIQIDLLNDDQNNALWFACVSENVSLIELLIKQGIDINNQNVNGATCLVYAASAGKFNVVKALVDAGASLHHQTHDGFNALDSASTLQVLRFLKPHYVNLNAVA